MWCVAAADMTRNRREDKMPIIQTVDLGRRSQQVRESLVQKVQREKKERKKEKPKNLRTQNL